MDPFVGWLLSEVVGPKAVQAPASIVRRGALGWIRRYRGTDELASFLTLGLGAEFDVTRQEVDSLRVLLTENFARGQDPLPVPSLIAQIAACLPPKFGRTESESLSAAECLTRAILEFGLAQEEWPMYAKLLDSRLARFADSSSSSAAGTRDGLRRVQETLFEITAELVDQRQVGAQQYRSVVSHLQRILEERARSSARRSEVAVYLERLIAFVDDDPWPRHSGLADRSLRQSSLEQRLYVQADRPGLESQRSIDAVAREASRLVVLGPPGSGKSWFARRRVRVTAERALRQVREGVELNSIEIPVLTTCARFFSSSGPVRHAVIASAIDRIGDLGSESTYRALKASFVERSGPMMVALDALDEAGANEERLSELSTVENWRILVTSRPAAWHGQLSVDGELHVVGTLLPLHIQRDVLPFIDQWFDEQVDRATAVKHQIARNRALSELVRIPLFLTFVCLVADDGPLPASRGELSQKVITRMLTGAWKPSAGLDSDLRGAFEQLRRIAVSVAEDDPLSGMSQWSEEFQLPNDLYPPSGSRAADALGHVLPAVGPSNVDDGTTPRRFVHRSLREYLVAGHYATFPAGVAAQQLLPHIWHDDSWRYVGPMVVAQHAERDELLKLLSVEAARANVDEAAKREWCLFLSRLADESSESDWQTPQLITTYVGEAMKQHWLGLRATSNWPSLQTDARGIARARIRSRLPEALGSMRAARDLCVLAREDADDKTAVDDTLVALPHLEFSSELVGALDLLLQRGADTRMLRQAASVAIDAQVWLDDDWSDFVRVLGQTLLVVHGMNEATTEGLLAISNPDDNFFLSAYWVLHQRTDEVGRLRVLDAAIESSAHFQRHLLESLTSEDRARPAIRRHLWKFAQASDAALYLLSGSIQNKDEIDIAIDGFVNRLTSSTFGRLDVREWRRRLWGWLDAEGQQRLLLRIVALIFAGKQESVAEELADLVTTTVTPANISNVAVALESQLKSLTSARTKPWKLSMICRVAVNIGVDSTHQMAFKQEALKAISRGSGSPRARAQLAGAAVSLGADDDEMVDISAAIAKHVLNGPKIDNDSIDAAREIAKRSTVGAKLLRSAATRGLEQQASHQRCVKAGALYAAASDGQSIAGPANAALVSALLDPANTNLNTNKRWVWLIREAERDPQAVAAVVEAVAMKGNVAVARIKRAHRETSRWNHAGSSWQVASSSVIGHLEKSSDEATRSLAKYLDDPKAHIATQLEEDICIVLDEAASNAPELMSTAVAKISRLDWSGVQQAGMPRLVADRIGTLIDRVGGELEVIALLVTQTKWELPGWLDNKIETMIVDSPNISGNLWTLEVLLDRGLRPEARARLWEEALSTLGRDLDRDLDRDSIPMRPESTLIRFARAAVDVHERDQLLRWAVDRMGGVFGLSAISLLVSAGVSTNTLADCRGDLLNKRLGVSAERLALRVDSALESLQVSVDDVQEWDAWTVPPADFLVRAVRLHSSVTAWLEACSKLRSTVATQHWYSPQQTYLGPMAGVATWQ